MRAEEIFGILFIGSLLALFYLIISGVMDQNDRSHFCLDRGYSGWKVARNELFCINGSTGEIKDFGSLDKINFDE